MTSLLIAAELPAGWRASLGFYHATRMKWLNDGDVIPSHGRTDLKLSRRFGKTGRKASSRSRYRASRATMPISTKATTFTNRAFWPASSWR